MWFLRTIIGHLDKLYKNIKFWKFECLSSDYNIAFYIMTTNRNQCGPEFYQGWHEDDLCQHIPLGPRFSVHQFSQDRSIGHEIGRQGVNFINILRVPFLHQSVFLQLAFVTWLPFGLFKDQIVQIWLFWNSLPDIRWFGHFWPFLILKKIVYFEAYIWEMSKTCNVLWNSNPESCCFNDFLKKIVLFSFLRIWPFLKLLMAKFGLFIILDLATLVCVISWRKNNWEKIHTESKIFILHDSNKIDFVHTFYETKKLICPLSFIIFSVLNVCKMLDSHNLWKK